MRLENRQDFSYNQQIIRYRFGNYKDIVYIYENFIVPY